MSIVTLTYGSAEEVAGMLAEANNVTQEELLSALINAMNRIDNLEKELAAYRLEAINDPDPD